MSIENFACLPADANPSRQQIEAAAAELGLPITLHEEFSLETTSGFQPGTWDGKETGVEIDIFDLGEFANEPEDLLARMRPYPKVVAFRWGSSALEGAFGCAVGAALISLVGGVFYEAEGGTIDPVETVVRAAHDLAASEIG